MNQENIIFELSTPYFQEQNDISEQICSTIIDMTRVTILEKNIDNELWPELVLVMNYVKNSGPTKVLPNLTPHKALTRDHPDISNLQILGSSIYVFLHK